jgi:CheY-like chemotaxis protein
MRPCFLVVESEYAASISVRKLVIESAKFNVITAYSMDEAVSTLKRFPNLDGIVLDSQMNGPPCIDVMRQLRSINAKIPIVTISPGGQSPCGDEQHHVSNFDPRQLLDALETICPMEMRQITRHDEEMSRRSPASEAQDN